MDVTIFASSVVAFLLYLNTLDADFAYDDSRAVQTNQDLEPKTPLINIFYDDFWGTPLTHSGSHKSYRPLCVLSFRLNYYFGELNPWGYHLGNVLLHAIVTAIFTKLSRIFLKETFSTLVSGLIFASHPVHTEAVAGVVGRADVGACLFFILALICYMEYVKLRDRIHDPGGKSSLRFVYFFATSALTTASMLTKEQGVTVLGVCAAYDLFVHNKMKLLEILQFYKKCDEWFTPFYSLFWNLSRISSKNYTWPSSRRALEGVFLLGMLGVGLVVFRVYFMGNKPPEFAPSDNPASDSDSFLTRTLTYLLLPALNIWLFLCPRILSFDWSMSAIPLVESVSDYRNIFTIVFYTVVVYLAYFTLNFINNHSKDSTVQMNGNGHSSHVIQTSKQSTGKQKTFQTQRQTSFTSGSDSNSTYSHSNGLNISSHSVDVLIFSIALIVLPFIPASNLFFYVGFVIAERVLYIPSMGFCLLVGHGCNILYKKYESEKNSKQKLIVLASMFLIALNSGKTIIRNKDWVSEERLYASGIAVNPPKAWGNLANVFNSKGRVTEAETAYRNALKYRPNMSDTHYNLGILLQNQKRYKEALESYYKAIHFRPNLSMAYLNLGILLAELGNKTDAEKVYRRCADLDTSKLKDPRLHASTKISCLYNLGRLYSDLSRNEEALTVFQEALRKRPDHYSPHSIYNLYGEVYSNMGRYDEAINWYKEALKVKPDHIPAHLTMAKVNHKMGNDKEADAWFLKAKQIDPEDTSYHQHYAQFLGEMGRLQESADMYRVILEKESDNFEMTFNAANIFRQIKENNLSEKLFEKAALLRPAEATAHMNLGAMYHMNGKLKEAEKSYLKALQIKPDDPMTKDNLVKLRNLMQNRGVKAEV